MSDLISREAVKDEFLTRCSFLPEIDKRIGLIILNDIPSADAVEVVHAKWMLDGRCSNCLANPLTTHKTYCPNCGADMRERKE